MKTTNFKKNVIQAMMLFASALTLAAFTACGKNGGDAPPPPVVNPNAITYGSCPTCGANSAFLASGTGNTYYANQLQGNLNLEFYGTGVTNTAGGQYQSSNYYGSVSAQGTLIWQVPSLMCGMPQGTYSVRTVTPGTWSNQNFQGLVLQATGPANVTIQGSGWLAPATPALVGLDGRQYPYQIVGNFWVSPATAQAGYPYGGGGGCQVSFINMNY